MHKFSIFKKLGAGPDTAKPTLFAPARQPFGSFGSREGERMKETIQARLPKGRTQLRQVLAAAGDVIHISDVAKALAVKNQAPVALGLPLTPTEQSYASRHH